MGLLDFTDYPVFLGPYSSCFSQSTNSRTTFTLVRYNHRSFSMGIQCIIPVEIPKLLLDI